MREVEKDWILDFSFACICLTIIDGAAIPPTLESLVYLVFLILV